MKRLGQWFRPIAAERFIHRLEAPDKIQHISPGRGAAGGGAKMGAAPEWAGVVGHAALVWGEQGAGSVGAFGNFRAPRGPHAVGQYERFAPGQLGRLSGLAEMTAGGASLTIALQGPVGQHVIDSADLGHRFIGVGWCVGG